MIYGLGLNDAISPLCEQLINFHDTIFNVLVFIGIWIAGSIFGVWYRSSFRRRLLEKKNLEIA
jgi:hypothetical protein